MDVMVDKGNPGRMKIYCCSGGSLLSIYQVQGRNGRQYLLIQFFTFMISLIVTLLFTLRTTNAYR